MGISNLCGLMRGCILVPVFLAKYVSPHNSTSLWSRDIAGQERGLLSRRLYPGWSPDQEMEAVASSSGQSAGEDYVPGFGIGTRVESRRVFGKCQRTLALQPTLWYPEELAACHDETAAAEPPVVDEQSPAVEPVATRLLEWNHFEDKPRRRLRSKTPLNAFVPFHESQ